MQIRALTEFCSHRAQVLATALPLWLNVGNVWVVVDKQDVDKMLLDALWQYLGSIREQYAATPESKSIQFNKAALIEALGNVYPVAIRHRKQRLTDGKLWASRRRTVPAKDLDFDPAAMYLTLGIGGIITINIPPIETRPWMN